ncbi:unnamed protein product [Blepharisma stoltei]|uniref:Calcium-dependent protein kinase n=1 Tax=Blepharisma stoltei TaxID=1481888 RepID=A0AAU9IXG8_9CILI|nr:unnamed protein product [Blepharisma stoltei]
MGCCESKRSDPISEKGQPKKSTDSLRSEIDEVELAPKTPRVKQDKKHKTRTSKKRSESFNLKLSSGALTRSLTLKSVSTKVPHPDSPNSQFNIDPPKKILKASIHENFKIIKTLHSAFHGDTLLSTDKRTGLKKVIKEVKKSAIEIREQKTLTMEAQNFQCFDHPNIVKLHEVYDSEEKFSLVYEFFSGSNLLEFTRREIIGHLLTGSIMRDILSGLSYCHKNKILHLGLNLEKIILDSSYGKVNCKLIGFSYPWEIKGLVKYNQVTCFMAPEILNGIYDSPASDIWSVGVILYLIIKEKPPFRGKKSKDLLSEYKRGLTFEGSEWMLDPIELKDLLSRMLEFDYNKRISVEDALSHPWIKNSNYLLSSPANNKAISNLIEFTSKDKIARAIFSFFKVNLTGQNESRQFIEIFKSLDSNKDGQITMDELLNETKNLDTEIQIKLQQILKNADLMKKGYIGFSEFLTACTDWNTDENIKKLEKAFKLCDESGDGQLSLEELKANIEGIEDEEWAEFFGNVDFDQSGTISFEELKQFLFEKDFINANHA